MIKEVKIISPDQVRVNTSVKGSVDNDTINPVIRRVQDTVLAYVLGASLMSKVQEVVRDPAKDSTDGRYRLLIDEFIAPFLWWQVAYALLPAVAYDIAQNGVNIPQSNQGNPVFEGTMALVKQDILSASAAYKKLLLDYLCANSGKFKEYYEPNLGTQNKSDNGKSFHGVEFY